jgi:hypothetical protein
MFENLGIALVNSNIRATYDSGIWGLDDAPEALEGESTPDARNYIS